MKLRNALTLFTVTFVSRFAQADVESSLRGLKNVFLGSILPIFAVAALGWAAFGFFTGNPNAKQNLGWAITGCIVLYGAQSIVDLIARLVQ